MKTKTELITPEIAIKLLEHNTHNRRISESTVASYATDMKNGRWILTHQGIAVDVNGTIQDGQHRLWAVVESGVSVSMNVSRDCPVEQEINGSTLITMDAIDRTRVRSTGQQMNLSHGIKNGTVVAAACRAIAQMIYPNSGTKRLSTAQSLMILDLYRTDIESVVDTIPSAYLRTSYIVGPLSVYHHGERVNALEIARQLTSLENMSSPIRTFRRYMEGGTTKINRDKNLRIMSRCILAFHEKENLSKVSDSEEGLKFLIGMFPSITKKINEALTPCRVRSSVLRKSQNPSHKISA